jgi:hypothetical protein
VTLLRPTDHFDHVEPAGLPLDWRDLCEVVTCHICKGVTAIRVLPHPSEARP